MKSWAWIAVCAWLTACQQTPPPAANQTQSTVAVRSQVQTLQLQPLSAGSATNDTPTLEQAYAQKLSHVWLQGAGTVKKLLPDDTKGTRHQRFLVSVSPQQTLLFAHNIDLAPRAEVQVGDQIQFKGEYIYNPKGGIMHWTHHDPSGKNGGWIQLNGHKYE